MTNLEAFSHRSVYREAETITLSESITPDYTYGYEMINLSGAVNDTLPVAADLNESVEVQITPGIEDLAEMLGHDPVRTYEYVRNNFEYEPYSGSLKGSQETLWEEAGNDVDLASLLIALYRASGIPTRYTYGTIEMPIEQAMNLQIKKRLEIGGFEIIEEGEHTARMAVKKVRLVDKLGYKIDDPNKF